MIPVVALALLAAPRPADAVEPVPSFAQLVTGNGFGFQVFDVSANAVKQFLERPYRYLRANPSNPDGEGIVRRNLAFDTYFGVRAGGQSAWLARRAPSEVGYVDQTNVIRSVVRVGELTTESFYVAPYGYAGNALVMLIKVTNRGASAQPVTAYSIHNFKLGAAPNPDEPGAAGEAIAYDAASQSATETGPGGGAMIYAPIGGVDVSSCAADAYATVEGGGALTPSASCSGSDRVNAFARELGSIGAGQSRWWGVAVLFDADGDAARARAAWSAFVAGRGPEQLYQDTLAEWEAWREPPVAGLSAAERRVWRQAEAVLRMGQVLEPYQEQPRRKNHGMILASLPPGGWHTGWVRDATYAIAALARTGHGAEARAALDFFLGADAGRYASYLRGVPYRISTVRYFGDGEEEADYSGAPSRNIEIDGWGLFLWAARAYVDASGDTAWLASTTAKGDVVYDAIRDGVGEALAGNLEDSGIAVADASIWEVHWGNRQHFLYTTAATARGFCDLAALARRAGRADDVARYRQLSARAVAGLRAAFVDSNHALAGSLERLATGRNYRDGATVEALTWSLVTADDPIARGTLGAMSFLMTPAGGYKRVEGSSDPYDTDEWILLDLRASDAFRRAGNAARADQLVAWVTDQASANFDLLPELYNTRSSSGQIGAYAGSIPMVGYGAGAYQLTLLARAGQAEPIDCGDREPGGGDGGVDVPDGDAGIDPGADDVGRTGVACVCAAGEGGGAPWGDAALAIAVIAHVASRRRRGAGALLALAVVVGGARVAAADPAVDDGLAIGDVRVALHGYARMPLATETTPRTPYLVDNDYYLSGFAYTRLYEPDWSELFLSAQRGDYEVSFGLFASLYSDYASPRLEHQLGIAQASVTARRFLGRDPLSVQLGVFWDRLGYLEPYDTYVFGRTHQGGVKVAYQLPRGGHVQAGVGVHQGEPQQNQGMTPIAHVAAAVPVGPVDVGAYLVRTWTRDKPQLSPIQDGTLWIAGADARYRLPRDRGHAYLALAYYAMDKVLYLAPALEVMHSTGGRGLTENFLGVERSEDGTGSMVTLAGDAPIAITRDVGVRAFGMATWVRSRQIDEMDPLANRDRRLYLKWGVEPSYQPLRELRLSVRYDRVILDLYDADNSFRVLSPKVAFPLDGWAELFVMYSHYWYGDKVHLRPGQVPLETEPDRDVFKIQAQVTW